MDWCHDCGQPVTPPYPCRDCGAKEAGLAHPYGLCGSVGVDVLSLGRSWVDPANLTIFESEEEARAHARICGGFYSRVRERKGEAADWRDSLDGVEDPSLPAPPVTGHPRYLTLRRGATGCAACDAAYGRHGDALEGLELRLQRRIPQPIWPPRIRDLFDQADQLNLSHRKPCEECGKSRHRHQRCECGWLVGTPRRVTAQMQTTAPTAASGPVTSSPARAPDRRGHVERCPHGAWRRHCPYCGDGTRPPPDLDWRDQP